MAPETLIRLLHKTGLEAQKFPCTENLRGCVGVLIGAKNLFHAGMNFGVASTLNEFFSQAYTQPKVEICGASAMLYWPDVNWPEED